MSSCYLNKKREKKILDNLCICYYRYIKNHYYPCFFFSFIFWVLDYIINDLLVLIFSLMNAFTKLHFYPLELVKINEN